MDSFLPLFVDILPVGGPTTDDDFLLVYDHVSSFEADACLRDAHTSLTPVCVLNCGYVSSWCSESFGVPLVAVELLCCTCGDDRCRFIMAPAARIKERIEEFLLNKEFGGFVPRSYVVPTIHESFIYHSAL